MTTKVLHYLAGCSLAALMLLSPAFGQTVTGSISGQVTDQSGTVIVGANVMAENIATSVKTTTQTNASGVYTIRFLPIGTYIVTVEATGLTTQKVPPFALEIDQTVKVDASLKIGTSATVVVQGDAAPILNTTDSSLGDTLSANEIASIPLNGRNFSSLTLFQPGAIDTDPTGMTGNNAIERNTYNNDIPEINGNRAQANYYTLEGADLNEPQNNLIAYNPAPDAIAEVRVISANAPATYGNANGGAIITILKSGTNHIHGSAYGLLENHNLDANTWGNDHQYPIVPKNIYTQSIFGGTIGGPTLKNKLFFFADYEGARRNQGGKATASVLTQAMRNGDFSALLAQGIQLYDTQNNFAPYVGDTGLPILNPVAKYLFAHPNLYPLPNATPTDGLLQNNFQGGQTSFVKNNREDIKIDWTPGNVNKNNGFYAQSTARDGSTALMPVFFPSQNVYPTKVFGTSWVHTFSSTIVNEARFGFTRVRWDNSIPTDPSGNSALPATLSLAYLLLGSSSIPVSPDKASAITPATSVPMPTRRSSATILSTTTTISPGSADATSSRSAGRRPATSRTTSTPQTSDSWGRSGTPALSPATQTYRPAAEATVQRILFWIGSTTIKSGPPSVSWATGSGASQDTFKMISKRPRGSRSTSVSAMNSINRGMKFTTGRPTFCRMARWNMQAASPLEQSRARLFAPRAHATTPTTNSLCRDSASLTRQPLNL